MEIGAHTGKGRAQPGRQPGRGKGLGGRQPYSLKGKPSSWKGHGGRQPHKGKGRGKPTEPHEAAVQQPSTHLPWPVSAPGWLSAEGAGNIILACQAEVEDADWAAANNVGLFINCCGGLHEFNYPDGILHETVVATAEHMRDEQFGFQSEKTPPGQSLQHGSSVKPDT